MLLACIFTLQAAHGQVQVKTKNISRYPFAADSARLKVPEVFTGIDSVSGKINQAIIENAGLFDSSLWPDIFKDSSFSYLHDSCSGLNYSIRFNNESLLILDLNSDFWYEPHPQKSILWFNVRSGEMLNTVNLISPAGKLALKDSLKLAIIEFKKSVPRKFIRRYYSKSFIKSLYRVSPENAIEYVDFNREKQCLHINYRCSNPMSCDLFGPSGTWVIDRQNISLFLTPELANQLK